MQTIPPFLYTDPAEARRAFARAWVTGDGLHSSAAVAQMEKDVEDTAEEIALAARFLGDRHQQATSPEQWMPVICEVANAYWQERRHA